MRRELGKKEANLGEAIEEGFGQSLPAAALVERVLTREQSRLLVLHAERTAQLSDVDLGAVVEAGV